MKPIDRFRAAREKISDPSRWTKGAYARDSEGHFTLSTNPSATCWCVMGAIFSTGGDLDQATWRVFLGVIRERGFHSYATLNDNSSHEEVLSVLDETIKRLAE